MKCDDCKYGNIVPGECRHSVPIITGSGKARWPKLKPNEKGCGKWKAWPDAFRVSCSIRAKAVEAEEKL